VALLHTMTDGVVTLRAPEPEDRDRLIAGRDAEWRRWLGPGTDDPQPTACIVVEGEVVGWVDFDTNRRWLRSGEVNMGYSVFAPHRGNGYASRAVALLLSHLNESTPFTAACLLIDPANTPSLAVAAKERFSLIGEVEGSRLFRRAVDASCRSAQATSPNAAVGNGDCSGTTA
jgi:RimJ/RimL family protein N-acetyltransferase